MTALNLGSLDGGRFGPRYAGRASTDPDSRAASRSQLAPVAKSPAGVRVGDVVGRFDGARAGAVCDLSRHRRARARHPFQPGMGAAGDRPGLGGPGADHPDLHAGFRRHRGAGGDCRHAQRDPAVSDGGVGIADAAHANDEAASSGTGGPFHRGHAVGRMLSAAAAGAARAAASPSPMGSASACCRSAWSRRRSATASPPICPELFAAAILLLTPLAFLLSTARNCRQLADVLALVLGLALFPLVAMLHTGVDILISGVSAGTIAYGVHRWRSAP